MTEMMLRLSLASLGFSKRKPSITQFYIIYHVLHVQNLTTASLYLSYRIIGP
jgi:hypothetical protein